MYKVETCGLVRISKSKARVLYDKGKTIRFTPCKCHPDNIWGVYCETNIKKYNNFDLFVRMFEQLNCSNALGDYAAYYVERGVLDER